MRKINKGQRPETLNDFCKKNATANWADLHKEESKAVYEKMRLTILVEEQDNRCAYTELPIAEEKDCHIDHYKMKGIFPALTFDWDNLLCSVYGEYGAEHKDSKFRIGSKPNTYNEIFNPVIDFVENHFYYNQQGEIEAKNGAIKPKVIKTVEVFNLNHPSLKNKREAILREIEDIKGQISNEDIEQAYQNRGFLSVVKQALQ